MTIAQKNILTKMNKIHEVRIQSISDRGTCTVYSYNKSKDDFMCLTVKRSGAVKREYDVVKSPSLKVRYQKMRVIK